MQRALTYSPQHGDYLLCLTTAYGELGREKEAKAALAQLFKILSLFKFRGGMAVGTVRNHIIHFMPYYLPPFKDPEMRELFDEGLRRAGIDTPSGDYVELFKD